MTRQEKLKEIGNMRLSAYTSKFIISVPHKFYENDEIVFKYIKDLDWTIENKTNGIKSKFDAFNIKAYIYNNMVPEIDDSSKKSFLVNSRTLILNKKFKDQMMKLSYIDQNKVPREYDFFLRDIDLWIFEEHIAFFVLNIAFMQPFNTINEINEFNNIFRNFKFLKLTEENDFINLAQTKYKEGEQSSFLEYLLAQTEERGEYNYKSFLNVDKSDCTDQYKNKKINELYSIYDSSTNAKLLLGIQTEATHYKDGTAIEEPNEVCMSFEAVREMSILDEIPFYLASCTPFNPEKDCSSNDEYIYQLVNGGGYNIWKYSSGLTIHDSSAFIGLHKDGGPIVRNVSSKFYFIYMLNLFITFQTKYIAHSLIDNNFESRDINYWYKKLQKLKNQFVADDIGIKFQENELNKSMSSALKMKDLLSEVSSNLVETKTITTSNRGIYITLVIFIFISFVVEPLKDFFSSHELYIRILALAAVSCVGLIAYTMRVKIIKKLKL